MARVRAHQRKDGSRVRAHDRQTAQSGERRGADPSVAAASAADSDAGEGGVPSPAERAQDWLRSQRDAGKHPSRRTTDAVAEFHRAGDALAAAISSERAKVPAETDERGRPAVRDAAEQGDWLRLAAEDLPDGMALNSRYAFNDRQELVIKITVEGPLQSRSDEFDAPIVRWAEDSSESPIGVDYRYRCEASETPVDTYPFAEYETVPAATPNGAKGQIMPDRMLLRAVAMQTRDRHLDVIGANAAVEANEQFDSFVADPKEPVGPLGGDVPSAHTRRVGDVIYTVAGDNTNDGVTLVNCRTIVDHPTQSHQWQTVGYEQMPSAAVKPLIADHADLDRVALP